jgi:putative hydrolase of the HAD superfamily
VIRAIIFDLGRVLVPFDFSLAYARIEALGGIPASEIPTKILPTGLMQQFESGEIEAPDFVRRVSALCRLDVSFEQFDELWNSIFPRETLIAEELVETLARSYRLVLLSNTNRLHFDMLRKNYPILGHFHSFVLSYEVGAMKPAAKIYRKAVDEAGCRPEECFFTDDVAAYVEGAREHGIDAAQFVSAAQLEVELRKRGVLA